MTPERWQQIEAIFHEALELDTDTRAGFVKKAAGKDSELQAEVEKLLDQYDDASSFIEQPLFDSTKGGVLSALLDEGDEDPMVGKVLGSYRVESEIGRGGMGAVYAATRADGEFRLSVAIKVVKRGIDTDFVLKRFRNERQILAALDHPFITRLIDGGTTDDGRPYFVMEHVDGMPLYRYADKNRLSINDRLRLFSRVCEAVEYAHQKQVIHRDIKPSNIVIANDGSPRLLDFGIAKLLDPEMASDTLQPTATALRMMTVDYASPEQIRGEKVTYATDVYSLGVMLFELLTGYRPYKLKSRTPHEVARAICDDDPVLPSVAADNAEGDLTAVKVNPTADTLTGIADLKDEAPARLAEQLRGNLDGIILQALAKAVEDRYDSVAALREDIDRHLKGETVAVPIRFPRSDNNEIEAGPDTKLVAVLPLSLMSGSNVENTDEAYLTVGLADAIITRLTSVRKLTVRPTSSITRYNEEQVNPFRAGRELGVDFVLDGRIRRFSGRLRISLQLLDVNKVAAIWAGQFDKDLTDVLELEDAISEQVVAALIPQLTGEDRRKLAKRGTDNPQAYEAYMKGRYHWNQFTTDSFPKAIECFQMAVELDPNYAMAYVGVADFYIWANIYGLIPSIESYRLAESSVQRALEIDDKLGEAWATLGLVQNNKFDWAEGKRCHEKAIELNPNYPNAHEWYSAHLVGSGNFAEGIKEIDRAEELDPLSLRTKTLVAWSKYQAHKFDEALAKAEEIVELDPNFPQGHLQKGYVLIELGRGREALAEIEKGMALMPESDFVNYYYCFALASVSRHEDARRILKEMKGSKSYVKAMFLAFVSVAVGEIDEAFAYLDQAADEFDPWLVWLGTEPKLDPIRSDKRYLDLMRRTKNPRFLDLVGQMKSSDDAEPITGEIASEATTVEFERHATGSIDNDSPGRTFIQRHKFKAGIAGALSLLVLIGYATGILSVRFSRGPSEFPPLSPAAVQSIAVLPFENNTGDPGNDYISDGMSDSLNSRISRLSEIRTVPRAAAFAYRSRNLDPRAIGSELGVDTVVTGTLQRLDADYMLRVEMTSVADGRKLMSISFVERPESILTVLDPLSIKVVEALNLKLATPLVAQKSYTENADALQLYLKGEYSRQKGTPAGTTESIELYRKALDIDPEYALAYQGLALAYRSAPSYGSMQPQEAYPKAKEAAQKALAIDPSLSTAYVSLASVKTTYDWDFAGAETEYKRAIQLSPNNSEAHFSYGNFLVSMGRSDEGLVEFRNAQQIDPLSQNIQTNIGWALYIAGRYDEALTQIRQVLARDPSFARAYMNLGEILEEQGKYDEAITAFQKARELSRDPLADMALGHVYAVAGKKAEAGKIAGELEEKVRQKLVSPFLPAVVYAGLNERDKSFYWLERAYQERSNWLTLIKVGRRLKNLHGDPRFDDLLKRVGFDTRRL